MFISCNMTSLSDICDSLGCETSSKIFDFLITTLWSSRCSYHDNMVLVNWLWILSGEAKLIKSYILNYVHKAFIVYMLVCLYVGISVAKTTSWFVFEISTWFTILVVLNHLYRKVAHIASYTHCSWPKMLKSRFTCFWG